MLSALLRRAVAVRPGERQPLLWSAVSFFLVMTSFFALRPLREAWGIERGPAALKYLWTGTLAATLVLAPLYARCATRLPPARLAAWVCHLGSACLLAFCATFALLGPDGRARTGYLFYVWLSAFNVLTPAALWSLAVDRFRPEQSRRLFGFVAGGATLGTVAGPWLTTELIEPLRTEGLLLLAVAGLQLGALSVRRMAAGATGAPALGASTRGTMRDAFQGLAAIARSRYLQLICAYLLLDTLTATLLYYVRSDLVYAQLPERAERAAYFAQLDVWSNALTFALEVLLAARAMARLGVGLTLAILPAVNLAGFTAVDATPTLAVVGGFWVARRVTKYGIAKPAREVLFTVLARRDKYAAKVFVDTVVMRGSDVVWIWLTSALKAVAGGALLLGALPAAMAWAGCGLALGRGLRRREVGAPVTAEPAANG